MITFNVPTSTGITPLAINPGTPFFIVGRNGTGKSALVHYISSQVSDADVIYLPGSRTSLFDAEGLNLTPAARSQLDRNLIHWDNSPDTRWRNITGNNSRNEKALHDLVAAEIKYTTNLAGKIADRVDGKKSTKQLQSKSSPLNRANILIAQANLPIMLKLAEGDLRVVSSDGDYS